jgi:hypothetical protein
MKAHCITAFAICNLVLAAFAENTNYQSPIDGKIYRADWRTYFPTNSAATNAPVGRVQKQNFRLLSTEEEFTRSIGVSELADFIRKTEHAIDSALGATNAAFELVVQTSLAKDKKPFFEMASKGDVSEPALQRIYDSLGHLPDLRSRKNDLKYEVRFAITKKP